MPATISIDIGRIYPSPNAREVKRVQVSALMESFKEIGLRTPITVKTASKVIDGREQSAYEIVAGHHRYEAAVKLGWREIPCVEFDGAALDAELWEIDENLCRSDLTELEQGRALARRKEIYEIKHPETKHGGDRKFDQVEKISTRSFATDAASKVGKSDRAIRNSVRIGERLSPEAEEEAKQLGLDDHQAALLAAAKHSTPGAQAAELRRIAAQKTTKPTKLAPDPRNDFEAKEAQVSRLMSAWNAAGKEAREEFLARIDRPVFDSTRAA